VTIPVHAGTRLMEVARALDGARVDVTDVHRREATLDDVFLTLTGAAAAPRKAAA
jgi:ABC-2 type transport system ATP-binding protein